MDRFLKISLEKRGVSCIAQLLSELAPRTSEAVWDALPQLGPVYHAKYARNEIYTLVPAFTEANFTVENPTITPIPGDVVYFHFEPWQLAPASHGYDIDGSPHDHAHIIDLALFYGRNNLLLNPDFGFVPGNVFATIIQGLADIADASNDLWRHGADGEVLRFDKA